MLQVQPLHFLGASLIKWTIARKLSVVASFFVYIERRPPLVACFRDILWAYTLFVYVSGSLKIYVEYHGTAYFAKSVRNISRKWSFSLSGQKDQSLTQYI